LKENSEKRALISIEEFRVKAKFRNCILPVEKQRSISIASIASQAV